MKLSVIIPVYNTEKYFDECIKSVVKSVEYLKEDYEIIVINDGSKGNIDELIKTYLKENKLIKYISQRNKGRGATRNVGLKEAKGKYINFIDSDDCIDINFYKLMLDKIEKENSDIVICDLKTIEKNKSYVVEAKNLKIKDNKIGCFDIPIMPSSCNKVIKRDLYKNYKFPEHINYEDLAINPLIMIAAKKISYISKPLYLYRLNENSVTQSIFNKKKLDLLIGIEIAIKNINKLKIDGDIKQRYIYMLSFRRIQEDVFENIVRMDNEEKKKLLPFLIQKMKILNKYLVKNNYYKAEINKNRRIKRICNCILNFSINYNFKLVVGLILTQRIFFKYCKINYTGIDGE